MQLLSRDKTFYKGVMAIAVPMALQNMLQSAVGMLDTIMLGQLGEVAMSASSLANQIGFIFMMINYGLTAGAGILTSQYWGKNDTDSIRKVLSLTFRISLGIGLIFAAGATFFPTALIKIYTNDPAIIVQGANYLRCCGLIYLSNSFAVTAIAILRTVGTVKIALYTTILSLAINLFFNYGLIFGNFGMPRLEVMGAAVATVFARLSEAVVMAVYLFKVDKKIGFRLRDFFRKVDMHIIKAFVKFGAPVLGNEVAWSIGNSMAAVVLGRLGAEVVAANSICDIVFQISSFFIWGVANAASVLTGNAIGAGEQKKAKEQSKSFVVISAALGLVSTVIILVLRGFMMDLYNVTDVTKEIAFSITNVMCIITVIQAMGNINMFGTLRGGGDSRFVLICDIGAMWGLTVPLGFLAGLVFHWPVWVVYLCLRSSEVFTCIAGLIRLGGSRWIVDVTKSKTENIPQELAGDA